MFQFPGYRFRHDFWRIPPDEQRGVAPFGNLRVKASLRLSEAYRSLPRPSSPPRTKSSTISPLLLNHQDSSLLLHFRGAASKNRILGVTFWAV
jgi:hypothetical protein